MELTFEVTLVYDEELEPDAATPAEEDLVGALTSWAANAGLPIPDAVNVVRL